MSRFFDTERVRTLAVCALMMFSFAKVVYVETSTIQRGRQSFHERSQRH